MTELLGLIASWMFVALICAFAIAMIFLLCGLTYFHIIKPFRNWLHRKKVVRPKPKIKRTKWTPTRFVLLISVMLSPCFGFLWPPLGIIMPLLGISTWLAKWKDPKYGYTKDWKFDWEDAFKI